MFQSVVGIILFCSVHCVCRWHWRPHERWKNLQELEQVKRGWRRLRGRQVPHATGTSSCCVNCKGIWPLTQFHTNVPLSGRRLRRLLTRSHARWPGAFLCFSASLHHSVTLMDRTRRELPPPGSLHLQQLHGSPSLITVRFIRPTCCTCSMPPSALYSRRQLLSRSAQKKRDLTQTNADRLNYYGVIYCDIVIVRNALVCSLPL